MRILFASLFALVALIGCKRGTETAATASSITEAGPGNYCQLGPLGLSVESTRLGKIRMRGMMGQDGESDKEVFTVKTRFKLFDASTPVKQPVLQSDGMLTMGAVGLKLKDETGREFNPIGGFGFSAATTRRTEDAILNAEKPEIADILTFESTIGAVGNLTLEVPGKWQVQQPDGKYLQPKETGTFRIRIPQSMWDSPPPSVEAGAGKWATVGPVSIAIENVRLGKVKMRGFGLNQEGESKESVFAIEVKVKLADPATKVKKPPFIPEGNLTFDSPAVTLKAHHGETFPIVTGFGFDRILGRQEKEVQLSAEKPEVADLLTFSAKAGTVDELFLTLWPKWQERRSDNTWVDGPLDGEFRFHIPKSMWMK
ncbi:MAG TPA: hypothetical protein VG097_02215 [Gemmata sp.]|jgi:hypothetical protein|nr:hypothetical protein [Gemmata sp.]